MKRGQALKGNLDLLVLAVLAARPMHGYAVIEALRVRSGDAFDLPEGTVYPVLHRLSKAGLLESEWTAAAGRPRRTYQLTDRGHAALNEQRNQWQEFVEATSAVLKGVQTCPNPI